MDKKEFVKILKKVSIRKLDKFYVDLNKVLIYGTKFKKVMFENNVPKTNEQLLGTKYKKEILNCKINTLSTLFWQNVIDKIKYSVLSWQEHDFIYEVMPKIQKVLVYMNSGSSSWFKEFLSLLEFIKHNALTITKNNDAKSLDWNFIIYCNSKLLSLFKANSKKRVAQAYGYIKTLLDVFIASEDFNKKAFAYLEKKLEKTTENFFKAILKIHNSLYSKKSKSQLNSRIIINTFNNYLKSCFSKKNLPMIKRLTKKYFINYLGKKLADQKSKRFRIKESEIIETLVQVGMTNINFKSKKINHKKATLLLSEINAWYTRSIQKYDSYESIFIIHLLITSVLFHIWWGA